MSHAGRRLDLAVDPSLLRGEQLGHAVEPGARGPGRAAQEKIQVAGPANRDMPGRERESGASRRSPGRPAPVQARDQCPERAHRGHVGNRDPLVHVTKAFRRPDTGDADLRYVRRPTQLARRPSDADRDLAGNRAVVPHYGPRGPSQAGADPGRRAGQAHGPRREPDQIVRSRPRGQRHCPVSRCRTWSEARRARCA